MSGRAKFSKGFLRAASVVGIAAVAAGMVRIARAQSQTEPEPLRFDVASVKVSKQQNVLSAAFDRNSGPEIRWTTTLWYLIQYAYNVRGWQIKSSASTGTIYEIDATTDPKATDKQVRQMFQALLSDRFKMTMHHENNVMDGYAITVAKSGLEVEEAAGSTAPPLPGWLPQSYRDVKLTGPSHWISTTLPAAGVSLVLGWGVTMEQLCNELQRVQQVPVVDRTGLSGEYYIAFEYLQRDAPPDADAPSLSDALKHLGLNLEKYRGPVDIIVVDHVESPTPD